MLEDAPLHLALPCYYDCLLISGPGSVFTSLLQRSALTYALFSELFIFIWQIPISIILRALG